MRPIYLLPAMILSLFVFGTAIAQEQEKESPQQEESSAETRREKFRKEMDEVADEIQSYSQARRDEAVKRAKVAIDRMDHQIEQLQTDWDLVTDRMSQSARENRDKAMSSLRRQRNELSARYRNLQDSSADIWAQVRDDFVSSYRRTADALRKAISEYNKNQPEEDQHKADPKPTN